MAAESFAMTLTVLATAVAGPVGLPSAPPRRASVSVGRARPRPLEGPGAGDAQQNVALDPELAKMSTGAARPHGRGHRPRRARASPSATPSPPRKGCAQPSRRFEQTGEKEIFVSEASKILGPEKAGPLGDKIAVRARAFPEGFMQVFPDCRSAHNAYIEALQADPTREVGIWRNTGRRKYVWATATRATGSRARVDGDKLWELGHPPPSGRARSPRRSPTGSPRSTTSRRSDGAPACAARHQAP